MKRKLLSILMALVMVIGLLPTVAFAEGDPEIYVGGVGMVSGDYLAEGASAADHAKTPAASDDNYAYYKDGVLTLKNYDYKGDGANGAAIYRGNALEIVLIGENKLENTSSDGNGITVTNAYLKMRGSGKNDKLTVIAKGAGMLIKSSIVIEKCSIDFTTGMDGISSEDTLYGRITITNADVKVKTSETGIYAYNKFSIADSTVDIDAAHYGIFVSNGRESSTVSGSTLSIDAGKNGIAVRSDVSFTDTELTIDAGETGISTNADVSFTDTTELTIDAKENGISTYDGEVSFTDSTAKITAVLNGIFGMSNSEPSSVSVKNSDVEIKSTTTGEKDGDVWAINVSDKFTVDEV